MCQLLVWEWQSETYILKQQGHYYNMNTMCYSQGGRFVATGGDDGKVSHIDRTKINAQFKVLQNET